EPMNWWVGMKNPFLQLIVYGENISTHEVSLRYPGVSLTKVHKTDNPNYLFLDLNIGPETQAGELIIQFKPAKGKSLEHRFPLLSRNTGVKAQGVNNKDFIYLIMPDRFANGDPANDVVKNMQETA